ncbi:hypothetical protein SAMN05660691_01624 [Rheinheimera pacifica]|uniref:Uncharacterized protein n=1 Tax=Rheinheimera pacifica TaxID=173990 RepID=A0A1H6L7R9_9GAMM|nr:hypothetical protein [Rheinheimera pacifica]SEH81299.1 hypothetical protein SAMN05660691_01624 [Rheinheimera pacifica]
MRLLYFLFIITISPVFGADCEFSLKHLSRRFLNDISTLPVNQPVMLSLDFHTIERQQADACSQRLNGIVTELREPLLNYNYTVTVKYRFEDRAEINEQWLREQYFLGVAYYCDWSGGAVVVE